MTAIHSGFGSYIVEQALKISRRQLQNVRASREKSLLMKDFPRNGSSSTFSASSAHESIGECMMDNLCPVYSNSAFHSRVVQSISDMISDKKARMLSLRRKCISNVELAVARHDSGNAAGVLLSINKLSLTVRELMESYESMLQLQFSRKLIDDIPCPENDSWRYQQEMQQFLDEAKKPPSPLQVSHFFPVISIVYNCSFLISWLEKTRQDQCNELLRGEVLQALQSIILDFDI
jgi:hypothetical protein